MTKIVYEAHNKVFSQLFETEEDARNFPPARTATVLMNITPRLVLPPSKGLPAEDRLRVEALELAKDMLLSHGYEDGIDRLSGLIAGIRARSVS